MIEYKSTPSEERIAKFIPEGETALPNLQGVLAYELLRYVPLTPYSVVLNAVGYSTFL